MRPATALIKAASKSSGGRTAPATSHSSLSSSRVQPAVAAPPGCLVMEEAQWRLAAAAPICRQESVDEEELAAAAAANNGQWPPSMPIATLPPLPRRCQSASSCSTFSADMCRICHCEALPDGPLIVPCRCNGSLKYVHQKCLQQWIKSSQTRSCEVCRYTFVIHSKMKPFTKWEKLDISAVEKRKVLCSVTFHLIAVTCVVWSLWVLIERTADEVRRNKLDWPFWTKIVVVAIGFSGGAVFMYVQCKMYAQLFGRWKTFNKVIYVQNCPEPHHSQAAVPVLPPAVPTPPRQPAAAGRSSKGAAASDVLISAPNALHSVAVGRIQGATTTTLIGAAAVVHAPPLDAMPVENL